MRCPALDWLARPRLVEPSLARSSPVQASFVRPDLAVSSLASPSATGNNTSPPLSGHANAPVGIGAAGAQQQRNGRTQQGEADEQQEKTGHETPYWLAASYASASMRSPDSVTFTS